MSLINYVFFLPNHENIVSFGRVGQVTINTNLIHLNYIFSYTDVKEKLFE